MAGHRAWQAEQGTGEVTGQAASQGAGHRAERRTGRRARRRAEHRQARRQARRTDGPGAQAGQGRRGRQSEQKIVAKWQRKA